MGTRGCKRKPAAIVALEGNKGRRPASYSAGPEPPVTAGIPEPPDHLGEVAKAFWRRAAGFLIATNPSLLTQTDLPALEHLAVAWERYRAAQEALATGEYVFVAQNGLMQKSPWLTIESKARDEYFRISQRFGLTPADRAGLQVPDPAKNQEGAEFFKNG